jgi:hypothetical protein
LAKRFPESAFPRVLIPVGRDPVSCDSPYLPDPLRRFLRLRSMYRARAYPEGLGRDLPTLCALESIWL